LIKQGVNVLSDAELLAIILKTGNKDENVIDMSNRLISKYGFDKLSECSLKELEAIKGIGKAKACQIIAIFELNKRHIYSKANKNYVKNSKDVYDYCISRLPFTDREQFMILHLDTKNRIVKDEIISIGTLNGSIAHPREVFKSAIKESSNAIILVHNHPLEIQILRMKI
jgi:DNA repair protein RadC